MNRGGFLVRACGFLTLAAVLPETIWRSLFPQRTREQRALDEVMAALRRFGRAAERARLATERAFSKWARG